MRTLNKTSIFHFKSQTWFFLPFLSPQQEGEQLLAQHRWGWEGHCHGWHCSHSGLILATPSAPNQPGLVFTECSTLNPQDTFQGSFSPIRNGSILCLENWRENTTSNQQVLHTQALAGLPTQAGAGERQLDPAQGCRRRVGICLTPGTRVKALLKIKHFPCQNGPPTSSPHAGWEPPCSCKQTPQKPLESWWCLTEGLTVTTAAAEGSHRPRTVCGTGESHSHWLVPVTLTL